MLLQISVLPSVILTNASPCAESQLNVLSTGEQLRNSLPRASSGLEANCQEAALPSGSSSLASVSFCAFQTSVLHLQAKQ